MPIHGRVLDLSPPPPWPAPAPGAGTVPWGASRWPARVSAAGRLVLHGVQLLLLSALTLVVLRDPPIADALWWQAALTAPAPRPAELSVYSLWVDQTPIQTTITAGWQKVPVTVPVHRLRTDPTLWRQMNFDDFDRLRNPLREQVLDALFASYAYVLDGPWQWSLMTAHDWDAVPQPMRAMAYVAMARYWAEAYPVGSARQADRALVADTLATLVMVESWFDHRGTFTNPGGDRDIGVGAASEYCRTRLAELYRKGRVAFQLEEMDYFNPWLSTLAMAAWFDLALTEAGGDLDLATRVYHRGIAAARAGAAADYLENVQVKRRRFIRNEDSSPTWDYLHRRAFAAPDPLPARPLIADAVL